MVFVNSPDKTKVRNVTAEFSSGEIVFFSFCGTYGMPANLLTFDFEELIRCIGQKK